MFVPAIAGMEEPVLVSGTDGVGTKLKIAMILDKHDTIGIDAVAMCVNDIICCGAAPLFFLDYIACGKNYPEKIASIVSGVAEGCVRAGCALIGGETAEHPGMMPDDEYDIAGFSVGMVDRKKMIDKNRIGVGDVIIALPSTGVHSNGFSLVRRVFRLESSGAQKPMEALGGRSLLETLLEPTAIYVKPVLELMKNADVRGIAHITGGGFYENIPRALPKGMGADIDKSSLRIPAIFDMLARDGKIDEHDMFNTYNMGVGMCVVVPQTDADAALRSLKANGVDAYVMGTTATGGDIKIG